MEILSTFHVRIEMNTFLCEKYIILPIQTNGGTNAKKSPKQPLPLGRVDLHLVHQCLGPPHSPCQMTARSVHALLHNYTTKSPLVTMGCPNSPKNCPFPSPITTPSSTPIPCHSLSQKATRSNQPFCHSTLSGETVTQSHTQTDRWVRVR